MWQHASLVRDAEGLGQAAALVDGLAEEAAALKAPTVGGAARILDLSAGLDCARMIVAAATFRKESRGAHWRSDFPETSDAWFGHTRVTWDGSARKPKFEFCPRVSALPLGEGTGVTLAIG